MQHLTRRGRLCPIQILPGHVWER